MAETVVVEVTEELGGVTRSPKSKTEQSPKENKQPADKKSKK